MNIKKNPSEILISDLKSTVYSKELLDINVEIKGVVLPVEYGQAFEILKKEIEIFRPDVVLSFGVAQNRKKICLERIAVNHRSKTLKDNSGKVPKNCKIIDDGPDGIFSNIEDIDELSLDLRQKGWSVEVSSSAGSYVCNSLMFETCLLAKELGFLYDFIHIPDLNMYSKLNATSEQELPSFVVDLIQVLKSKVLTSDLN